MLMFALSRWGPVVRKAVHECLSTQWVYFEIAREGVVPKALRQNHANFKKSAANVVSGMRPSGGGGHVTVLADLLCWAPLWLLHT